MNITSVRIRQLNPEGRMKAVASVTFDEEFVIHDVRVVEGHNGPFVAMPSRKDADSGNFRDIAHPTTPECRERVQSAVLVAYAEATEAAAQETGSARAERELHALVSGHLNTLRDEVQTGLAELAGRKPDNN